MSAFYLGLDIGGTKCAVLLASADNGISIKSKLRFETHTERGFAYTYGMLCESIDRILTENHLQRQDIRAIGISCGGPLDSRNGIILCPPNLPGWINVPIKAMLEERYGIQTFIQNDANACALVEWRLGAGRGTQNMVFLTMGTGLGAGIIADGRLLCGHCDMAGEVGHIRMTDHGPVGYGKAGSLEGWVSGGGIGRQAIALTHQLIEAGTPPVWVRDGHEEEEISAQLIASYARQGDPDARSLFHQVGDVLGRGIAVLADILNPERVVIGSVFARCEDLIRPSMEKTLAQEAIPTSIEKMQVVPAQTGEQIGDLACIMTALYGLGESPLPSDAEEDRRVMPHYHRLFQRYPQLECCRESIMEAYRLLRTCYRNGGKVLLLGNGGSCADCEHIVGELMKGFLLKRPLPDDQRASIRSTADSHPEIADCLQQGLPAISLNGHTALTTAAQNDLSPLAGPAQQLMALGKPGDVLIGISTSGNAENVALTVSIAHARGLSTIGLTGGTGGKLKRLCDCAIVVPESRTADVQELHLPVYHTLCAMLEACFFAS